MPKLESLPQSEMGMETGDQHADIPVGKMETNWKDIVREHGYDPKEGYTELDHDGQYHWRPWPSDPVEKQALMEELAHWDAEN